jgi:hypothetical protein
MGKLSDRVVFTGGQRGLAATLSEMAAERGLLPAVRSLVDFLAREIPRIIAFAPARAEEPLTEPPSKRAH